MARSWKNRRSIGWKAPRCVECRRKFHTRLKFRIYKPTWIFCDYCFHLRNCQWQNSQEYTDLQNKKILDRAIRILKLDEVPQIV